METNKEQQHTPEPWEISDNGYGVVANSHPILSGRNSGLPKEIERANIARSVECVNVLKDVSDPEFYITEQKKVLKASLKLNSELLEYRTAFEGIEDPIQWVEDHKNNDLMYDQLFIDDYKKYKTACEQINKDNPLAVAENLKEMVGHLRVAAIALRTGGSINTAKSIEILLTKIQEK